MKSIEIIIDNFSGEVEYKKINEYNEAIRGGNYPSYSEMRKEWKKHGILLPLKSKLHTYSDGFGTSFAMVNVEKFI